MRVTRTLTDVANSTSAIYKIVFTALMLFELVRFGLKRRKENAANFRDRSNSGRP